MHILVDGVFKRDQFKRAKFSRQITRGHTLQGLFIGDAVMNQIGNRADFEIVLPVADQAYAVRPQQADEVLVSAFEHLIDTVGEEDFSTVRFGGINYMALELDFIVD